MQPTKNIDRLISIRLLYVRSEQEMAFFQQHGQLILASGDSIVEVLRIFNALPVIIDNGS